MRRAVSSSARRLPQKLIRMIGRDGVVDKAVHDGSGRSADSLIKGFGRCHLTPSVGVDGGDGVLKKGSNDLFFILEMVGDDPARESQPFLQRADGQRPETARGHQLTRRFQDLLTTQIAKGGLGIGGPLAGYFGGGYWWGGYFGTDRGLRHKRTLPQLSTPRDRKRSFVLRSKRFGRLQGIDGLTGLGAQSARARQDFAPTANRGPDTLPRHRKSSPPPHRGLPVDAPHRKRPSISVVGCMAKGPSWRRLFSVP